MPRYTAHTTAQRLAGARPTFYREAREEAVPTCACGRPTSTGWTDEEDHASCCACEVALTLEGADLRIHRPHAPRRVVECACGCGRVAPHIARGMVGVCYHRWYSARKARAGRGA